MPLHASPTRSEIDTPAPIALQLLARLFRPRLREQRDRLIGKHGDQLQMSTEGCHLLTQLGHVDAVPLDRRP